VLHGGGNTSVKIKVTNKVKEQVEVIAVKGSGWDLSNIGTIVITYRCGMMLIKIYRTTRIPLRRSRTLSQAPVRLERDLIHWLV
jgi:hypothetical protein